jgi:hypothetical protein
MCQLIGRYCWSVTAGVQCQCVVAAADWRNVCFVLCGCVCGVVCLVQFGSAWYGLVKVVLFRFGCSVGGVFVCGCIPVGQVMKVK